MREERKERVNGYWNAACHCVILERRTFFPYPCFFLLSTTGCVCTQVCGSTLPNFYLGPEFTVRYTTRNISK